MAIHVTETFEVARVEVGDDYRVHVWQAQKSSSYTPEQALQLAAELEAVAIAAQQLMKHDLERMAARTASGASGGPL